MEGRSYVMMGSLSSFTLREVLDVVGLSRQHTVIELHEDDGSKVASINLKGGHLVQGASDEHDPREVLGRALEASASRTFHVFRLDDADSYHSYGRLVDLLEAEATTTPAAAVTAKPVSKPAPVLAAVAPVAPEKRPVEPTRAAAPAAGVSLAVASPKGGAGKTTIALNLGISLARRGLRVIVIDADVNGDLLSLINARGSVEVGSYDLLQDPGQLESALRRTVVQGLQVLPAVGREFPKSALMAVDRTAQWSGLIRRALALADVVLVDCPAGMSHAALHVLQSVSHVLGVFQAETVASRSFEMFERALDTLAEGDRPKVAGVVVNMLRDSAASTGAYRQLVAADASRSVLKTAIRRSDAFDEAAAAATPVLLHGADASRKVAWLFDNLASELASRLPVDKAPGAGAGSFII